MEVFGRSLVLADFPKIKAIRGLGLTDQTSYAQILAEKFDYTNTYYDREPRFDLAQPHPALAGSYDFILMADVLEHIAPPIECALQEACRLLKPRGFLGITVYCNSADQMREHFPELNEYRIVQVGEAQILVNRKRDGSLELRDDLIFHGGSGATLEMREFGITALEGKLLSTGFREVFFFSENVPEIGVIFDHDVSQPLIARKEPFVLDRWAASQLIEAWQSARDRAHNERCRAEALTTQIGLAAESRWLRLGRRLGLGPKFHMPD